MVLLKESEATGSMKKMHEKAAKQIELDIVKQPRHHALISRFLYS